jgi:hypothetical protein
MKQKKEDLKLWLSISNQRNVPNSLLLYARINDFMNEIFEISDDEDDQEVLRRVSQKFLIFILFSHQMILIISRR